MRYHALVAASGFRMERDLVTALRERSSAVLQRANVGRATHQVFREQQVGMCIPDLLIVRSNPREDHTPLRLSYFDCALSFFSSAASAFRVVVTAWHSDASSPLGYGWP